MQNQGTLVNFGQAHAAEYDKRFSKLAPFRDALHLLVEAIFAELPVNVRVLCVGAGTGAELLSLAEKFPQWHFTAVEPSAPMLELCRRKAVDAGIAERCVFHEGYLESLPATAPFDAATSLLVSHFIVSREKRVGYFREIAERLGPGGLLASADLASDVNSEAYQSLLEVWLRLMKESGFTDEQIENLRVVYGRDVALLPLAEVSEIIVSGGFEAPVLFLQTGLIHGWYTRRSLLAGSGLGETVQKRSLP